MSTTSFTKRATAVVGAAAIALLAVLGTAAPASAATANIDTTKSASLTIHKFERTATNGQVRGTGQQVDTSSFGQRINDVEFTVSQIKNIDLTKSGDWDKVAALVQAPETARTNTTNYGLVSSTTLPTKTVNGVDGVAEFKSLPIGAYLVEETKRPNSVVEKTASFIVTVPTATTNTGTPKNTWIYDVNVYPKNAQTMITKSAEKAASTAEALNPNLYRWKIQSSIPLADPKATTPAAIEKYSVTDTLTSGNAEIVTTLPTGVTPGHLVKLITGTGAVTLVKDTHYTETLNGTTGITFAFTAQGLTELNKNRGGSVEVQVLTRATSATGGVVTNTASSAIKLAGVEEKTNTIKDPVSSEVAKLVVNAFVNNDNKDKLKDVPFKVYPVAEDGTRGTTPISINGKDVFTTNEQGQIVIDALKPGKYVVVETTVPGGFQSELPTLPFDGNNLPAKEVSVAKGDTNVVDAPHNQSQLTTLALPFTGGNGPLIFGLGGGALLALALGAALVVSRRRAAEARVDA